MKIKAAIAYAPDQPLKKVFSMTGEYGLRNLTVKHIRELKGQCPLTQTMVFTAEEATAAEAAGIDILDVRYNPDQPQVAKEIRLAAPTTFMSFALPISRVTSEQEALRMAFDAMEAGADTVMCQWSLKFIAAVASAGIPIQGHVGLVPRKSTWTGGLRAVGKTFDEAMTIYRDIKDLENAGAWAVECEVIPSKIMCELSKRTSLITVSIGSGSGSDVQFLFAEDILGDCKPPVPRHAKQYCNLYEMRQKMQDLRIQAFTEFVADVRTGAFPSKTYEVAVDNQVVEQFVAGLDT